MMKGLMDRLDDNSIWEPNSGCRIWLGALKRDHGAIKVGGVQMEAHRVAWELERGPIPKGLWVLHSCGLGPCINVNHLRLGTRQDNASDRVAHGGYRGAPGGGLASYVRVVDGPRPKRLRATDVELDQAELRRILSYDPETGELRWRVRADRDQTWNVRFAGELAGAILPVGYRYVNFRGKLKTAHRIIWIWMTGEWPTQQIDHINRDRADNRWSNLRLATQKQNSMNQGIRSTNSSGVKGVSWDKAKNAWSARITVSGREINLGRFKIFADAVTARRAAEQEHHGVFAHIEGTA